MTPVPPTQPEVYEVEAATRVSRLGAAILDGLLFYVPAVGLALLLVPMALAGAGAGSLLGLLLLGLLAMLALAVTQIVLLVKHGQTVGKRVLGIRLMTSSGEIPSIWRVFFLRWLPFFVVATIVDYVFGRKGLGSIVHLLDVLFIFQPTRKGSMTSWRIPTW
jgi:uncharacterized RDD family membrane protein YckC